MARFVGLYLICLGIWLGFFGITQREHFFAVESGLYHQAALGIAKVKEFLLALFANVQPVRAAFEFLAPAFNEFAFVIEDHHAVGLFARRVDGVMNVDMPVRIFADAVRVAVLDVGRKLAPIMGDFVGVLALSYNRLLAAGFIGCPQDERSGEASQKHAAWCVRVHKIMPESFPLRSLRYRSDRKWRP